MIPLKAAFWTLGAAVTAFLLWFGYGKYQNYQDAKVAAWKREAIIAKAAADSLRGVAAQRDTDYVKGETVYLRGRDILLNPRTGKPPASPEVKACFALADSSRSLCARRHDADTAALHATERELKVWQNKPSGIPRIQAYGEAMYDVTHAVPVIRAGATAKVFGPVHLSVAGEYAAPQAGKSDPAFRALAGLRINF